MQSPHPLTDTHVHVEEQDDVGALIVRARAASVTRLVIAAADLTDARRAVRLAAAYPDVFATAGLHPHDAHTFDGDLTPYRELAAHRNVIAIGEVGVSETPKRRSGQGALADAARTVECRRLPGLQIIQQFLDLRLPAAEMQRARRKLLHRKMPGAMQFS